MAVEERISLDEWEAGELAVQYDDQEPEEVIRWVLETFPQPRVALCTSFQIDGMAILDMAWRINPDVRIFTVDTGRMPEETLQLIERVKQHYGIEVETYHPDAEQVRAMIGQHGVDLFYKAVPLRLT